MLGNSSANNDFIRTKSYVLGRTNYGESDRILKLITPEGKISVIAKGVRKEKSKLAGGIELFCLSDVVIRQGKGDLGILTSSKLLTFYQNLLVSLPKMELAALILKKISSASEHQNSPDFFKITDQTLKALNQNIPLQLIEAWFWLNLVKASGGEVNLYRDTSGNILSPDKQYVWDTTEQALREHQSGNIGANEIKFLRLVLSANLDIVSRVKNLEPLIPTILYIAKSASQN